jgi:hypothetical protein
MCVHKKTHSLTSFIHCPEVACLYKSIKADNVKRHFLHKHGSGNAAKKTHTCGFFGCDFKSYFKDVVEKHERGKHKGENKGGGEESSVSLKRGVVGTVSVKDL